MIITNITKLNKGIIKLIVRVFFLRKKVVILFNEKYNIKVTYSIIKEKEKTLQVNNY